jgi:hypothetical protein
MIICVFYTIVSITDHTKIRLSYKYRNHYALNDIISISLDFCFQERMFYHGEKKTVCCGMITFVREAVCDSFASLTRHQASYSGSAGWYLRYQSIHIQITYIHQYMVWRFSKWYNCCKFKSITTVNTSEL